MFLFNLITIFNIICQKYNILKNHGSSNVELMYFGILFSNLLELDF